MRNTLSTVPPLCQLMLSPFELSMLRTNSSLMKYVSPWFVLQLIFLFSCQVVHFLIRIEKEPTIDINETDTLWGETGIFV